MYLNVNVIPCHSRSIKNKEITVGTGFCFLIHFQPCCTQNSLSLSLSLHHSNTTIYLDFRTRNRWKILFIKMCSGALFVSRQSFTRICKRPTCINIHNLRSGLVCKNEIRSYFIAFVTREMKLNLWPCIFNFLGILDNFFSNDLSIILQNYII